MNRDDQASTGVVVFATVIGLGTRLAAVLRSPFPLNDGGLFYTMIADLLSNRLALPQFTSYNLLSIPFAYPPLGLYLYAILTWVFRIPLLELVQFGPPILSAASIPAFYCLAAAMLESKPQAAMATVVFSLLPRSFDWLIMGGGVTRTVGMLFALLAMRQAFFVFGRRSPQAIAVLIAFGSLAVYSHPEAATHTAVTVALFYLWRDRTRAGFVASLLIAAAILMATAPWWGLVVSRHGLEPFLAASAAARQDSYTPIAGLLALFRFDFADEPFVTILTVLGLVGVAVEIARRRYLLPLWMLVLHTIEPRGGTLFMTIPLGMCAGIALDRAVLPALLPKMAGAGQSTDSDVGRPHSWLEVMLRGRTTRLFVGFVVVYGMMSSYATGWRIVQEFTLGRSDLRAFEWVRTSTASDARFAIVTGELPLRDPTSEWFPPLAERQSVGTVFGYEWLGGTDFAQRVEQYRALQACSEQHVSCLDAWSRDFGLSFDYVFLRDPRGTESVPLGVWLQVSPELEAVYSSETIKIYRWQRARLGTIGAPTQASTSTTSAAKISIK